MTSLDATRSPGRDLHGGADRVRTCSFDALGHVFAISCEDASFALMLEHAFSALAVTTEPGGWYDIRRLGESFELTWMGDVVVTGTDRAGVLGSLQWDVDRRAVAAADDELVVHAGCVASGDRAVLIGGPAGCGKSTLVAALVSQGFEYLTDVAVPVDLVGRGVRPFPRPMTLDDAALDLLPEIAALRAPIAHDPEKRLVSLPVARSTVDHDWLEVAMVVFPERDASGLTVLETVNRGDAVVRLAKDAFNFPRHGSAAIDALTMLLQCAEAYRVVGADPRAAARSVVDALGVCEGQTGQRWRGES